MNTEKNKFNEIISIAYHNVLLLEETKRKYSKTTTSFRDRNAMEYIYEASAEGKGFKSQSDIAEFLRISRPSCTVLIKKLEDLGYVKRVKSPSDERSVNVYLTRKGRLVTMMQCSHRNDVIDKVIDGFSVEEQEAIFNGFNKLNEVLDNCVRILQQQEKENKIAKR